MVHAPDPPGHGAREWPARRAITPGLAEMLADARPRARPVAAPGSPCRRMLPRHDRPP